MDQNGRPISVGTGGRFESEPVADFSGITSVIPSPNLFGTHGISETTVILRKGDTCYLRICTDAAMTTRIQQSALIE